VLREVVGITIRFGSTYIIIELNASIVVKALKPVRIEFFFFRFMLQ
jgi:hypothetical protein